MNRNETTTERLERQLRAVADLQLDDGADEEDQRAVVQEAARRATMDSWPEMPEDDRNQLLEGVLSFEGFAYLWAIYKRGWSTNTGGERISLNPETSGPQLLARAYAAAEFETLRIRNEVVGPPPDQPRLEDRIRRYLRPGE